MGEWPTKPLEDVVDEILDRRGVTPLKLGSDFTAEGHRVISAKLIKGRTVDLAADEARFVDTPTYLKWMRTPLAADDVLLTSEAPLGEVAYLPADIDWVLGQRLFAIRADKRRLLGRFLYYALQAAPARDDLLTRATGTTAQGIRQSELRRVRVPIPPLSAQLRIAAILGAFDDKIELNRRTSETIERMAHALFEASFGARETDHAPSVLGDVADVIDCLHAKKPDRRDAGRPLLHLGNIRDDGLLDMSDAYLIDHRDYEVWTSRIEARPGDCVITNVGRVGAVAQIPPGVSAALGRNMTAVRCRPNFPYPTFVLEALRSKAMRAEIDRKTDAGTILSALNVRNIPRLELPAFDRDGIARYERVARPLRARMEMALAESHALRKTRDALLPRLLSGALAA